MAMLYSDMVAAGAGRWQEKDSLLKRTYVEQAAEYGIRRMNELIEVREPHLYQIGLWLDKDNPARYVAAFNSQSEEAKRLAKFGYASLQATSKLVEQLYSGIEGRAAVENLKFPTISLLNTALHDQCPLRVDQAPRCPDTSGRYRTADGRCNNPAHPWWGASMMPLHRFLPSNYRDGLERVRTSVSGGPLPSARAVSTAIHSDRDTDLASITHMVMQWGQFLDHDLTSSAQTRGYNGTVPKCCVDGGGDFQPLDRAHPDCMAIAVPPDDWFYSHYGIRCLEFVRSMPTSRVGCSLGPRDQINQVSSFIDGSAIYGSSEAEEDNLRMFRNGLLKYSRVQYRLPLLPAATHKADLCRGQSGHIRCFHAGDKRVNEQPGLIALHTIWLRAHNKIATELSHINPHWRDEKLYQETRRIIGALMQHITFKEFLPIVLGSPLISATPHKRRKVGHAHDTETRKSMSAHARCTSSQFHQHGHGGLHDFFRRDVMKLFDLELMRKGYFTGYDIKTNPTAANAFGTAAFRFGHSLVQHSLVRCDRSHKRLRSNVSLHEELTNPSNLYNIGSVDRLLLGLCQQPAQKRDEFITEELTNRLFQTPRYGYGMDLAALNIQRGRDHGLAPYTAWREPCGLQSFTEWSHLLKVMSQETQHRLKRIYRDLDDIDLFPGGMAERPVSGGLVGPTFACILAQQFGNVRKGDRFWYENGGFESSFTLAQLQQIRHMTLARILCDNLDGIDTLQPFVFLAVDSDRNHRVPCDSDYIPYMDLKPWAENHKEDYHEKPTDHEHSPSYQKPSYPPYQKPISKPSYQESTTPSYVQHKPSYLIDFGSESSTKPNEQHKPSYLIDNNFQGKPTRPQNLYRPTTSKYPKPQEVHKPTYLIEESFQQSTKRPHGGYRPSDSSFLPLEHKEPYHNHNNYDSQLPSKLETKPNEDYNHHHYHHSTHGDHVQSASHAKPIEIQPTYAKPHDHYSPVLQKPHEEYPQNHHEPLEEYPQNHHEAHEEYPQNHLKPHEEHSSHPHISQAEYHPNHHKPHDEYHSNPQTQSEYPSYSNKPNDEYPISHHKPHEEYPSDHHKPNEEYTPNHHKPNEEYYPTYEKPQQEYPHSHHKPHDKYPSYSTKPQYGYTTSKPHYGHQTQTQPQYLYTFTLPLTSTTTPKPHYGPISFTNSYGNGDIPSTLDYNKYKPKPSNPSTGTYALATKPPSINHYNTTPKRPSYGKPSLYQQYSSYNYIKVFNEPSYYYLEDGKIVSNVSGDQNQVVSDSGWKDMTVSDSSALKLEPRAPIEDINIPVDEKIDAIWTTLFDTARSENKETVDIVTIEGSVVNINIAPEEEDIRKITVTSNKINITEDNTTNHTEKTIPINNLTYSNIINSENTTNSSSKELNIIENSEADDINLDITSTDVAISTVENYITYTTIGSKTEITSTIFDVTEDITDTTLSKEASTYTTTIVTEIEDSSTAMEDQSTIFSETTINTSHRNEENNTEQDEVTNSTDEIVASTSNYMLSTSGNSDYEDDWIYVEEVENDSLIPEMPALVSDPMALKELPRPMIFEDEESSRTL